MSDLTAKEQKAVRTALRFLRLRVGAWGPLAKALRYEYDSIQKVASGKKAVTPALALRVARFAGVPIGRASGRPVVVRAHLPALRPPAGGLRRRGHDRRQAPGGGTYKWLDLAKLAGALMPPPKYTIDRIRYFTALVRSVPDDPDAPVRQQAYLRALNTLSPLVTVHHGYFMAKQTWARLVTPLSDGTKAVEVHKTEEKVQM